jgi:hypothetical protein
MNPEIILEKYTKIPHCIFSPCGTYLFGIETHSIFKINYKTKEFSTFAGNIHTKGFTNGPRLQALFNRPSYLQFTPNNKYLLVCDYWNRCIRAIEMTTGLVTTFAGGQAKGVNDGPKEQATFGTISKILFSPDNNHLFICDHEHTNVRKLNMSSGCVTTFTNGTTNYKMIKKQTKKQKLHPCFNYLNDIVFSPDGIHMILNARNRNNSKFKSIFKINMTTTFIQEINIGKMTEINGILFTRNGDMLICNNTITNVTNDNKNLYLRCAGMFRNFHYSPIHNTMLICDFYNSTVFQFQSFEPILTNKYLKFNLKRYSYIPLLAINELIKMFTH